MGDRNDDPVGIPSGTRLLRRINPEWVVYDRNDKQLRPTSQNFQDSKDGTPMSVFAENIAFEHGETPESFLKGRWAAWHLAAVPVDWMRQNGQIVYLDPDNQDPDDRHYSHAAVQGHKDPKTRRKLGEKYEWVVPPSTV